jgi:hypothetical protein
VLCHNCWSWVPHDTDQCPDCHRSIDLSEPDPSPVELEELFGPVSCRLGPVRCDRRKLPAVGDFFGMAGGLLFLPKLTALPNGAWQAEEEPPDRFWQLSRWWSLWGGRASTVSVRREWTSAVVAESPPLVEQFLNAPGAVFVPRDQLIRAALRGRVWTISRTLGRTLRFTALGSADEARQAWRNLLSRDPAWRQMTSVG